MTRILTVYPHPDDESFGPAAVLARWVAEGAELALFQAGHLPITGEALALPLVPLAGSTKIGDAA